VIVIGPYLRMRRGEADAQPDAHALRDFEARLDEPRVSRAPSTFSWPTR